MEISIQTPSLLFPAICLLFLAYTNRFLGVAGLIRRLYAEYQKQIDHSILEQIKPLRKRLFYIRNMQALSSISLLLCILCMFLIYEGILNAAKIIFGVSIGVMFIAICFSIAEIYLSVHALNIQLKRLERGKDNSDLPLRQ